MDRMQQISKLLTGNISEEEKEKLLNEIEGDPDKKEEYLKYLNLWKLTSLADQPTSYLKRSRQFERFWRRKTRSARSLVILRSFLRYAAVFIAAVLLLRMVQYVTNNDLASHKQKVLREYTLETNYGSISKFQLKDESTIWLNTNSKAVITEMKKQCIVQLEGEAFFDIVHDEDREFRINFGNLEVVDMGTRFNISAYPEDSISRVVLLEGKIELHNQINNSSVPLSVGEGYVYDERKKMADLVKVDGTIESSWKDGKFVFIDKSLRQICDNLGKWYNVEFIYSDPALADIRYTCILKRTTTVDQIMKILNSTSGIDYEIIDNVKGSKDIIKLN
jgi:transmembrane sensor